MPDVRAGPFTDRARLSTQARCVGGGRRGGCAPSQGAAGSEYDPYQLPNNFSVQALDSTQNGNAGNLLAQFVSKYRLLDGPDGYLVQITG